MSRRNSDSFNDDSFNNEQYDDDHDIHDEDVFQEQTLSYLSINDNIQLTEQSKALERTQSKSHELKVNINIYIY
jgi:hypothetical protein